MLSGSVKLVRHRLNRPVFLHLCVSCSSYKQRHTCDITFLHLFHTTFSKILPVLRVLLFQPRFHVKSDGRETSTNIVDFLEFYTSKCFFLNVIRKYTTSLYPHMMKSLNKSFTLVSAGFEICQDRQKRLLFDEKIVM